MLPTKTLSIILQEKLSNQNPRSNGHLTSFDVVVLIIAHVWFAQLPNYLLTMVYQELTWNFLAGFNEGNI